VIHSSTKRAGVHVVRVVAKTQYLESKVRRFTAETFSPKATQVGKPMIEDAGFCERTLQTLTAEVGVVFGTGIRSDIGEDLNFKSSE
jgi:hypothetical protein